MFVVVCVGVVSVVVVAVVCGCCALLYDVVVRWLLLVIVDCYRCACGCVMCVCMSGGCCVLCGVAVC